MVAEDLDPCRSRLLSRRPPEELSHLYEDAARVVAQMHADGKLQPIGPWHNEHGEMVKSWPDDEDVLGCYMDILGLNGRPIVEHTPLEQASNRVKRRQARAARG